MHIMRFFCIFLVFIGSLFAERGSSAPFISGDGFRDVADFLFDETSKKIDPEKIKDGDVVFLKSDYIREFFKTVHLKIKAKYIIVSHNSDHPAPGPCARFLNDKRIIAWFAQNVEGPSHPKLHPIPIGLANKCWSHGNPELFAQMQKIAKKSKRNNLLYMNFSIGTCFAERSKVWDLFSSAPYCVKSENRPMPSYLKDLSQSLFSLSPRGNGIDCHRTWEILYMGAIPIVRSSTINPLYEDLPVLVINDWEEITEEFLKQKYYEMSGKEYNWYKLDLQYWLDQIDFYRQQARKGN